MIMHNIRRFLYAIVSVAMIALSTPLQAKAELINIQFVTEDSGPPAYTGQTIAGIPGSTPSSVWNQAVGFNGQIKPLQNSFGTDIKDSSVTFLGETSTVFYDNSNFVGSPYENLMTGYISTNKGASMTFTGLNANAKYDLYVYTQGNTEGQQLQVGINGVTQKYTSTSNLNLNTFQEGTNYLKVQVLTNGSGGFTLNYVPKNIAGLNEGIINGLSLSSSAPEPSTVVLVGIGGLLLAFRLRRSPLLI